MSSNQFPTRNGSNKNQERFSAFEPMATSQAGIIQSSSASQSTTKTAGDDSMTSALSNGYRSPMNMYTNPTRRIYDPAMSMTAVMLPRTTKMRNKWYRWFYDHDELVGNILSLHAELPYSQFEMELSDPFILRQYQQMIDETHLFSKLTSFDLEYMIIGEVFINSHWSDSKGYFTHIQALNPDFVDVTFTPFVEDGYNIELIPDDDLRKLVNSTKPEDQALKKRLPKDILNRVLTGRNISLNPEEVVHIARKSSPFDTRGTSMLLRCLRLLIYEDKLREAQITIADNFVYPLKLFLLGDQQNGWIPNKEHQSQLAQMLQQANFDPNFSLIYHYGLKVEYITVADKLMNVSGEWDEINRKKMAALGVASSVLSSDVAYSSANVGLQTQLARYKVKRDLFEEMLIHRNFKIMAERNEYYRRDKRELLAGFRVKRSKEELKERLMIPDIIWHKKLVMRDDQSYLAFLNNVYNQGKGPISGITFLRAMGLDAAEELNRKNKQKHMEDRTGEKLIAPLPQSPGSPSAPGAPGVMANIKGLFKFGVKEKQSETITIENVDEYVKASSKEIEDNTELVKVFANSSVNVDEVLDSYKVVSDDIWLNNLKSPKISSDIYINFITLRDQLDTLHKKYSTLMTLDETDIESLTKCYKNLYLSGKVQSYGMFNNNSHAMVDMDSLYDYADVVLVNEFQDWIRNYKNVSNQEKYINLLRSFGNSAFAYGQLKVLQENGINFAKLSNVQLNKGMSFKVKDILSYRCGMAPILSPKDEILFFTPKIEYFKYNQEEEGQEYLEDSNIYKTCSVSGIFCKNVPVEYISDLTLYLNKVGHICSNSFRNIEFVKDITELDCWRKSIEKTKAKEYENMSEKEASTVITMAVSLEKAKKASTLMSYLDKSTKTLFVSNQIDSAENRLIDKLVSNIDVLSIGMLKSIEKTFGNTYSSLTADEITLLVDKGYIDPVLDTYGNVLNYKVSNYALNNYDLDDKLKVGKVWDTSGVAVGGDLRDPIDIFRHYLPLWVEYPHNLNKEVLSRFSNIFSELTKTQSRGKI